VTFTGCDIADSGRLPTGTERAQINQFRAFWSHRANDGTCPGVALGRRHQKAGVNGNDLADRDHC